MRVRARLERCIIGLVVVTVAMFWTAMFGPAHSSARTALRPLVLKARFTEVRGLGSVSYLRTSASYTMVYTGYSSYALIDDRTGRPRQLPAGCTPVALTGITLACEEPSAPEATLDDLRTGRSSVLRLNPQLLQGCGLPLEYACPSISAVGTDWVAFTGPAEDYHVGYFTAFQNRATGQLVGAPMTQTRNVDLNARALTVPVCSPLKVPEFQSPPGAMVSGSLLSVGHGYQVVTARQAYLERCGTHLRLGLYSLNSGGSISTSACLAIWSCPPAANAHSIVWAANAQPRWLRSVSGIFLPSLRRFTITPATRIPYTNGTVAMTDHHLYVIANDRLWETPAPTLHKH